MSKSSFDVPSHVLHFLLRNVRICIDLHNVDKVMPLTLLENVPGSPPYLVGLMNLAGKSIPVIDLAMRLGLTRDQPYSVDTPIILCTDHTGAHQAGMIVDKIIEITEVNKDHLQMHADFDKPDSAFLAIISMESELSLLININHILTISLIADKTDLKLNDKFTEITEKLHQ